MIDILFIPLMSLAAVVFAVFVTGISSIVDTYRTTRDRVLPLFPSTVPKAIAFLNSADSPKTGSLIVGTGTRELSTAVLKSPGNTITITNTADTINLDVVPPPPPSAPVIPVESPNTVYAGPAIGQSFAPPAFRKLTSQDIPPLPYLTRSDLMSGTVTSVGLVAPSIFNVSGSPVTSSGDLTMSLATQSPNLVFAGPASGSTAAVPTFRTLTSADLPALTGTGTVTSVSVHTANGFSGVVANPTTTPDITLSVTASGMLKGSSSAIVAANSGSDYCAGTAGLSTGILKSTTGTGALSIASASDFPILNQDTTGKAGSVQNLTISGVSSISGSNTGDQTITLSGDVTGSGTGAITATLATDVNVRYVDFLDGNDTTGTGSATQPWKTLQHAYNSISPSINRPFTIKLSGGNNDTDTGTITAKPNVSLVADYEIQISRPLTITGGITNDSCTFTNIIFIGAFTWVRNDATALGVTLNNCSTYDVFTFEQQGAGVSQSAMFINSGGLTAGCSLRLSEVIAAGADFFGTFTYKDSGAAYLVVTAADIFNCAMSLSGGITAEFSGCIADVGFTITTASTTSGTPLIMTDSGSIPSAISGPGTLQLTSQASHTAYTPAVSSDWSSAPTQVAAALDQLAAKIKIFNSSAAPGGSATVAYTVTGLLSTDKIISVLPTATTNSVAISHVSSPGVNSLTVVYTADPGANSTVNVIVLR